MDNNIIGNYFEVFDKNRQVRYGITSKKDMENIQKKYPEKYVFERFEDSYVDLQTLESRSKVMLNRKLTFNQMIMLILVMLLAASIVLGIIFPESASILKIVVGR